MLKEGCDVKEIGGGGKRETRETGGTREGRQAREARETREIRERGEEGTRNLFHPYADQVLLEIF
jgi:hypothetical protein